MPDEFHMPDVLPTDRAELEALEAAASAAFTARYDSGATTPEDIQELQELAESVRRVREAVASDQGEPEEPAEPVEEPASPDEAPAEVEEPPVELTPDEEPEPEAPSAAAAVLDAMLLTTPAAPAAPTPTPEAPVSQPAAQAAPAPVPESLAAAAEVPPDFQMAVATPHPVTIVASADIPGVPATSTLDGLDGLVRAMNAKARSLGNNPVGRANKGYPVATLEKPLSASRSLDGLSEKDQIQLQNDLASPALLLASGGWCAPSEIDYSFACEVEAPPEEVNLPTTTTRRGGVKYPISPTFRDFYADENNGLFTWTEADDISALDGDPTKPCFHIPCVTFDEARLELEGLCATAGNLTDLAYPELIRRYLNLLFTAHRHRMNAAKITKMVALVDDTVTMAASFAAASAILDALELQAADLRDQFSMSDGALIEVMLPRWVRGLIRVDVARREQVALDTVSNADIVRYLQAGGLHVQFVSDWQLLGDPDNPATAWPTSVYALMWLPGAIRELTGPSLNINVARDSVLNATNDFSVAFTEESYQIYAPGCGIRGLVVPVCPNGTYGAPVELACAEES